MPTVNDITVLNIDETPYEVSALSEQVQALVEVYNAWNQKEVDAQGELAILQAAKQTLSAQIVAKVREESAAATEAAALAEANTTEANVTTDESSAADTEAAADEAVATAG